MLWSSVLGLPVGDVGMDHNFLSLGGDLIIALKLSREAQKKNWHLEIADVLRSPILVDTARVLPVAGIYNSPTPGAIGDYEAFSLLKVGTEKQSLINRYVVSACLLAENDNVADIHPVIAFQAVSIKSNFSENRNMLNYFTWTGLGVVDVERIRKAVFDTVDKFDALRSAFFYHQDLLLQVVLKRRPELEVTVYETNKSRRAFTEEPQDTDMEHLPRLGDPPAQFAIVQHLITEECGQHFTFVVRMSHVQYDGTSMQTITEDLARAYNNPSMLDESRPLRQRYHVHHLEKQDKTKAH